MSRSFLPAIRLRSMCSSETFLVSGISFLTMLNTLGNANTFWVYALLNLFFILLTVMLIPEAIRLRSMCSSETFLVSGISITVSRMKNRFSSA
jgi:uncharacterized membrane protein